jgi:hypothetical protein
MQAIIWGAITYKSMKAGAPFCIPRAVKTAVNIAHCFAIALYSLFTLLRQNFWMSDLSYANDR